MKIAELNSTIGKEALHRTLGRVLITGVPEKTRSKVSIEVIDRGPGWNEKKRTYTGFRFKGGWSRGQNYQHGHTDIVPMEHLKMISNEPELAKET